MLGRAWDWLLSRPYLLLIVTTLSWGGNAVVGRLAVGEVSPMALTALRWVVVCAVLVAIAGPALARDWPALKRHWPFVLTMGTLGYTGFNSLFYWAAQHTTAVNLTILQGSIPVVVLIGALLAYGTPIRAVQILGMAITLAGVVVLAARGNLANLVELDFNIGDVAMLAACVLYAGYTVGLRNRPKVSGLGFFAVMAAVACITSAPLMAVEIAHGDIVWPTLAGLGCVLYVGLFPSLLSQLCFMRAVELIGPGRAGLFVNLVPVFGALLAVAILSEPFGLHHALALALVLVGILLAEWKRG